MKHLLVVLLLAGCGAPPKPLTEVETVPTNATEEPKGAIAKPKIAGGFASYQGFPIPADAEDHKEGSGGSRVFTSERTRDIVHDELVPHLKAQGWRIKYLAEDGVTKVDEKSMFMNGYRFYAAKADRIHFISITKVENQGQEITVISVTLAPVDASGEPMKPGDL